MKRNTTRHLIAALAAGSMATGALAQGSTTHYWAFDDINDSVGGLVGEDLVDANDPNIVLSDYVLGTTFGGPYAGSGNAMETQLAGRGFDVDVQTGGTFDFSSDFAVSFWYYNDFAGDGDTRSVRVYDTLAGTSEGIQLGSNLAGLFNARFDDDVSGTAVITNTVGNTPAAIEDAWSHVVINFDYGNTVDIYFDGVMVDSDDVSGLTGTLTATQRLQIGQINGGGSLGASQQGALDDLAWYDALLDAQQIADLAAGTTNPSDYATPSGDPADLDGDGDVDDADFGIAFAAFTGPNNGPSSNPAADLDGDGDVDDADFGIAFAAFTGPGGAAVPEPASLALLGLGGLLVARRRRA